MIFTASKNGKLLVKTPSFLNFLRNEINYDAL